ncbi:MAG: sigma-E processing peptidase SpoIIGA [Eubacteriales bacterium]|nr:sigma-E processing peptidase SpoIIGA [Eubacteriales bacterium]MDD4390808.1 sigma-E processing peptidase SpoIIGA [Eubacteriales bacterium]
MKIYAEYLFLENFIVGLGIIYLTSVITGLSVKKLSLFAGGALCGLFSFTILLDNGGYAITILQNAIFSAVLILLCFGKKGFGKSLLAFWIISFILGGTAICILFTTGSYGVIGAGALYMQGITYVKVGIGFIAGYTFVRAFSSFLHKKLKGEMLIKNVSIKICGMDFSLSGYVDTGNSLKEPVSGASVLVISEKEMEKIKSAVGEDWLQTHYCAVPFKSAGVDHGILNGFRPDSIEIEGERYTQSAVVAVYTGEFKYCGGCSLLLGQEFIQGGLV